MAIPTTDVVNEIVITPDQLAAIFEKIDEIIAAMQAKAAAQIAQATATSRLAAAEEVENVLTEQQLALSQAALVAAGTLPDGSITITTESLSGALLNRPYQQVIEVETQASVTNSVVSGLPNGLAFDSGQLAIVGTPTELGTFTVRVQLFTATGTATRTYPLETRDLNCA